MFLTKKKDDDDAPTPENARNRWKTGNLLPSIEKKWYFSFSSVFAIYSFIHVHFVGCHGVHSTAAEVTIYLSVVQSIGSEYGISSPQNFNQFSFR